MAGMQGLFALGSLIVPQSFGFAEAPSIKPCDELRGLVPRDLALTYDNFNRLSDIFRKVIMEESLTSHEKLQLFTTFKVSSQNESSFLFTLEEHLKLSSTRQGVTDNEDIHLDQNPLGSYDSFKNRSESSNIAIDDYQDLKRLNFNSELDDASMKVKDLYDLFVSMDSTRSQDDLKIIKYLRSLANAAGSDVLDTKRLKKTVNEIKLAGDHKKDVNGFLTVFGGDVIDADLDDRDKQSLILALDQGTSANPEEFTSNPTRASTQILSEENFDLNLLPVDDTVSEWIKYLEKAIPLLSNQDLANANQILSKLKNLDPLQGNSEGALSGDEVVLQSLIDLTSSNSNNRNAKNLVKKLNSDINSIIQAQDTAIDDLDIPATVKRSRQIDKLITDTLLGNLRAPEASLLRRSYARVHRELNSSSSFNPDSEEIKTLIQGLGISMLLSGQSSEEQKEILKTAINKIMNKYPNKSSPIDSGLFDRTGNSAKQADLAKHLMQFMNSHLFNTSKPAQQATLKRDLLRFFDSRELEPDLEKLFHDDTASLAQSLDYMERGAGSPLIQSVFRESMMNTSSGGFNISNLFDGRTDPRRAAEALVKGLEISAASGMPIPQELIDASKEPVAVQAYNYGLTASPRNSQGNFVHPVHTPIFRELGIQDIFNPDQPDNHNALKANFTTAADGTILINIDTSSGPPKLQELNKLLKIIYPDKELQDIYNDKAITYTKYVKPKSGIDITTNPPEHRVYVDAGNLRKIIEAGIAKLESEYSGNAVKVKAKGDTIANLQKRRAELQKFFEENYIAAYTPVKLPVLYTVDKYEQEIRAFLDNLALYTKHFNAHLNPVK